MLLKFLSMFFSSSMTSWPFDWKTPWGFVIVWLCESAGCAATMFAILPLIFYLFGSCWLFAFIADDIADDLTAFNETVKASNAENRSELSDKFCAIMQFYADAKE